MKVTGKNVGGVRALHDKIGDAGGDHARFARPGTREDKEGSLGAFHRALLRIVQVEKSEFSHREPRSFMAKGRTGQPILMASSVAAAVWAAPSRVA